MSHQGCFDVDEEDRSVHEDSATTLHPAYDIFMLWRKDQKAKDLERFLVWRDIEIAKEENDEFIREEDERNFFIFMGEESAWRDIKLEKEERAEKQRREAIMSNMMRQRGGIDDSYDRYHVNRLHYYYIYKNPLIRQEIVKPKLAERIWGGGRKLIKKKRTGKKLVENICRLIPRDPLLHSHHWIQRSTRETML